MHWDANFVLLVWNHTLSNSEAIVMNLTVAGSEVYVCIKTLFFFFYFIQSNDAFERFRSYHDESSCHEHFKAPLLRTNIAICVQASTYLIIFRLLQLYCPTWISSMKNSGRFPQLQQRRVTRRTVQAGCFGVSMIRRTLTRTRGSLMCACDLFAWVDRQDLGL